MSKQVVPFLFDYHQARLMGYRNRMCPDFASTDDESKRLSTIREFTKKCTYWQCGVGYHELNVISQEGPFEKVVREFDLINGVLLGRRIYLYEDLLQNYVDAIDGKVYDDGLSFLFYGANGSGKTLSAVHLLCSAIDAGMSGYYVSFKELMNLHNNSEFGRETAASKVYNHILNCDFLVVDEVGKESKVSENVLSVFEHVIKSRVSDVKPTVLVTNLEVHRKGANDKNVFLNTYGNSVYSALFSNYRALGFHKGGQFRAKTRKDWDL